MEMYQKLTAWEIKQSKNKRGSKPTLGWVPQETNAEVAFSSRVFMRSVLRMYPCGRVRGTGLGRGSTGAVIQWQLKVSEPVADVALRSWPTIRQAGRALVPLPPSSH